MISNTIYCMSQPKSALCSRTAGDRLFLGNALSDTMHGHSCNDSGRLLPLPERTEDDGVSGALRRSICVAFWHCGSVTVIRDFSPIQGWARYARISPAALATPDPDTARCDVHRL